MSAYHASVSFDRVRKGIILHALGHVSQTAPDQFTVKSESFADRSYSVTPDGCNCPDGEAQRICKHMWAAFFVAAVVIDAFRRAHSLERVSKAIELFRDHLRAMPPGIKRTVRVEYLDACKRLRQSAKPDVPAWVKPHEQYIKISDDEAVVLTDQYPGYPYENRPGWWYRLYLIEPNWSCGYKGSFDSTEAAITHARAHAQYEWMDWEELQRARWR